MFRDENLSSESILFQKGDMVCVCMEAWGGGWGGGVGVGGGGDKTNYL